MTPQQVARVIEENFKYLTTAEVVASYRIADRLPRLVESLQYMTKGNREAIIDCLHGVVPISKQTIEREELVDKDIIESFKGE